jgi:hypothetical protein
MPRELMFLQELAREARLYPDLFEALGEEDCIFLMQACRKHVESHVKRAPLGGEGGSLLLVHPFYRRVEAIRLSLPDAGERQAMVNIEKAAKAASGRMPVVLIDDFPSYALESSGLVEDGLVDHVIFTYNWDPKLVRSGEMAKLHRLSPAFMCGCYGRGRCISHFFTELYRPNANSVIHLKDAILYSPNRPLKKFDDPFERQYMARVGITTGEFAALASGYGDAFLSSVSSASSGAACPAIS